MQPSQGLSIHIGLNHVDPDNYGGWDGKLSGCINDAHDMQSMAQSLGFQTQILLDSEATTSSVIASIGEASRRLTDGDLLLITYSGHGGQVPDINGDEDDAMDETWVLWDRQLIDDELYSLWSQFAAGVRIVVLSDSCHSGSVLRMLRTYIELAERSRAVPSVPISGLLRNLADVLGVSAVATDVAPVNKAVGAPTPVSWIPNPARVKTVPPDVLALVNAARSREDAVIQWIAGPSEKSTISATALLISGCQDAQLSLDGVGNGLFTQTLKEVWNDGKFRGDYRQFAAEIASRMPVSQQPNFMTVGSANAAFEAQTPLTIAAPQSGSVTTDETVVPEPTTPVTPVVAVTPEPAPAEESTTRPTLRRGDTGPDVAYLQTRLRTFGYTVSNDGIFGPMTESAVRSFQSSNSLEITGIVDASTWMLLVPPQGASPTDRIDTP